MEYISSTRTCAACLRKSLQDLATDYLDLYLIHFLFHSNTSTLTHGIPEWFFDPSAKNPKMHVDPVPLSDTWRAMEELVDRGLVKEIGVCNYNVGLLHDLIAYSSIKPACFKLSHTHSNPREAN